MNTPARFPILTGPEITERLQIGRESRAGQSARFKSALRHRLEAIGDTQFSQSKRIHSQAPSA